MFKKSLKLALVAAFASCAATSSMANLVTNGGFEAGTANWSIGSFGIANSSSFAHSGNNSMVTGCVGHACVTTLGSGAYFGQSIATEAGGLYDLSFWVGEDAGPTSEFSVFWNGALIADVVNPANNTLPTPGRGGMIAFNFTALAATGASTYFEIHGRQDPAGIFFDDVSVENSGGSVPEPGSLALVGLALAGLVVSTRRAQ